MKFRYARHTNNIAALEEFYTKVLGLKELGRFENHSGYNGIFLGLPDKDWHLEFTECMEEVHHFPDDDDLIVFYLESQSELSRILNNLKSHGIRTKTSKNPYWNNNGIEIKDPDGFGVILTLREK